ncbi:MAG: histidine kinase dimerization/phospho-acceptor domain-containing protein [Patulibacter sp.]|nr:histidine kinase dimerization/phospho-acceptor domain-containing protein [Patulibacter sp.]
MSRWSRPLARGPLSLRVLLMAALTYVLLLTIVAFSVPLSRVLGDRVNREVKTQARAAAEVVAATIGPESVEPPDAEPVEGGDVKATVLGAAQTAANQVRGRVIVVDAAGRIELDSASPPAARGTAYGNRPEFRAALAGRVFQERRSSADLGRELLVTAVPVRFEGKVVGAVRVSQDVGSITRAVHRGRLALLGLGLLVLAVGLAVAAFLAARIARPLAALEEAALGVAEGDMTAVAPERGSREQVSVARAFNTMTDRLDRTLTAQQQFVANASHQLRTPLTGVRLRIEEALAESPGREATEHLEAATAEVDRLSAMIDDLLVLGRSGERPQTGRPVALAELAEGVARRMRPSVAQRGRDLRVISAGDAATVLADRGDLVRVLDAFVENALVYGAGAIDLIVRGARVEVADRGPGLAPGEADGRLFDRFQRGSAGRRHPGTGLGLAIATTLAARWGGTVGLEPREGGGAVAFLDLTGAVA